MYIYNIDKNTKQYETDDLTMDGQFVFISLAPSSQLEKFCLP